MVKMLKLDSREIRGIIAEKFGVPSHNVSLEMDVQSIEITAVVHTHEEKIEQKPQAYWEYWGGWRGNHDQRIEGAPAPIVDSSIRRFVAAMPRISSIRFARDADCAWVIGRFDIYDMQRKIGEGTSRMHF